MKDDPEECESVAEYKQKIFNKVTEKMKQKKECDWCGGNNFGIDDGPTNGIPVMEAAKLDQNVKFRGPYGHKAVFHVRCLNCQLLYTFEADALLRVDEEEGGSNDRE